MTSQQGRGVAAALNPAESAHTRRVAAWCAEIAAKLDLPVAEREILKQVIPLHQRAKLVLDAGCWSALARDLGIALSPSAAPIPDDPIMQVLHSLHGRRAASQRIHRLALIVEQCDDLDAACELDAAISGEPEFSGLDGIVSEIGAYFGGLADGDIQNAASRLPVFPSVAYRAITLLANVEVHLDDVESLVAADQTLASHIVRAANSVLFNSVSRVKTVREAVTRIGLEAARQIVSAACFKTMFESKHAHSLWNHSLEVAEEAANIASRSGRAGREEAFLAGLMHDVGKLVILNLPTPLLACRERLALSRCPGRIVERVILGESHAVIGASLLRQWRFAESIAECAEKHHTPEQSASPLSSIVYVAEFHASLEKELPSDWRLQWALQKVGLSSAHISSPPKAPLLSSLRFAAAA